MLCTLSLSFVNLHFLAMFLTLKLAQFFDNNKCSHSFTISMPGKYTIVSFMTLLSTPPETSDFSNPSSSLINLSFTLLFISLASFLSFILIFKRFSYHRKPTFTINTAISFNFLWQTSNFYIAPKFLVHCRSFNCGDNFEDFFRYEVRTIRMRAAVLIVTMLSHAQ